jgi:hypothetical protein
MDFIKIIRSLEEFLYEVMSWIIFYPRTILRILLHPTRMTTYSEAEQDDLPSDRFTDALSPPLLLMLTIVLTHGLELASGMELPHFTGPVADLLIGNDANLLLFRALVFATIPLLVSWVALRRAGKEVDRVTLRAPFYGQCYLVTPFALFLSIGITLSRMDGLVAQSGQGMILLALGWFFVAQTQWFRLQQQRTLFQAVGMALLAVSIAFLAILAIAVILALLLMPGLQAP